MKLRQAFTRTLCFASICFSLVSVPVAAQNVTPPGAPRNVMLVPWDDAIRITWEAPASWGTWAPVGYEIEVSGDRAGWLGIANIIETSETTTQWIQRRFVDDLPEVYNGQKNVRVRIRAVTARSGRAGERTRYSDGKWVTSNKVTIGLPAVSSLRITPRESQLDLAWNTLLPRTDKTLPREVTAEQRAAFEASNRKYAITGYDVHYTASRTVAAGAAAGTSPATGWVDANYSGTGGVATIRKLNVGTRYRVRVRPVNGWGTGAWLEGSAVVPGPPKVLFNIHTVLVPENDDYQEVKLVLNQVLTRDITVNLSTTAAKCTGVVTATAGAEADYTLSATSFTFTRGGTLEHTLRITPREDQETEGREVGCVSMEAAPAGSPHTVDPAGVYLEFVDTSQGSDIPPLRFYDYPVEEHGEGSKIYGVLSLNTPRAEDVNVTITVTSQGTATAGEDYTVLSEFLTGTIKGGQALYDRTSLDSKGRNLLTIVDDDKLEGQETIKLEARIDGEDYVARKTIIIIDNDGIEPVKVRPILHNGKPSIEFESSLQSACGRHAYTGSLCGLAANSYRYSRKGYAVLFQVKESGQNWDTPHDYSWQVPDSADGSPAPTWNQYALFTAPVFRGRVENLKPGVTYDVRAYTSHVPAAWTGGSFDRSAVEGKEIYGAADAIVSNTVSVTLGSIPSPPRLNNLEAQADEITASWDEPVITGSTITGYELQWKKSSSSNWNKVPISASNRSYTITQVESVEYEVRVKATNAVGDSDWSEIRRAEGNPPQSQLVAERPTEGEESGDDEDDTPPPPPPPPNKISATFENVPDSHDGTQFRVDLRFGEDIAAANGPGYSSFDVINGYVANYYRRNARLYWIYIQPDSVGADVKVLKHEGTCTNGVGACSAAGKISTRAGYITIKSQRIAPVISRDNAAQEGDAVEFTITLSRSIAMPVTFNYKTNAAPPPYTKAFRSDSCRTPAGWNRNPDLIKQSGSITFQPRDSSKTISIATCPADSIDEPDRYFNLQLKGSTFSGVRTGLGRIYNNGSLQSAWLSRLGRTVGAQITDAVTGRFTANAHTRIAGLDLGSLQPQSQSSAHSQPFNRQHVSGRPQERAPQSTDGYRFSARDLLLGSSFHHAIEDYAAWGNFQQSHFAGSEIHNGNTLHLDGTVLTGVFGADAALGRLLAGAAIAWTDARGTFQAPADSGALTSRITTLTPYARVQLTERLSGFGLLGYGVGDTTIEQTTAGSDTHATVTLDHTTFLAAAGIRGALPTLAGLDLALNADTLYTATDAPAAPGSAAAHATAARVRFGLEASRAFLQPGYSIHPTLELAARYDAGDAETGAGLEVATGLGFTHKSGVSLDASARELLTHVDAHEDRGISLALSYTPRPTGSADQLGWTAALTTSLGNTASTAGELWHAHSVQDLTPYAVASTVSVEAVLGYGFAAFRNRVIATPRLTARDSALGRETQFGWRFTPYNPAQTRKSHFEVNFDVIRTVSPDGLSYGAMLQAVTRW